NKASAPAPYNMPQAAETGTDTRNVSARFANTLPIEAVNTEANANTSPSTAVGECEASANSPHDNTATPLTPSKAPSHATGAGFCPNTIRNSTRLMKASEANVTATTAEFTRSSAQYTNA